MRPERQRDNDRDEPVMEDRDKGKRHPDDRRDRGGAGELEDDRVIPEETLRRDGKEGQGEKRERRVQEIVLAEKCRQSPTRG